MLARFTPLLSLLAIAIVPSITNGGLLLSSGSPGSPSTDVGVGTPSAAGVGVYSVDDGSGESSVGAGAPSDIVWLNQFTSAPGLEMIGTVRIAFGHNGNLDPPADGSPITAGIWSDPNNDGNPTDAMLLGSVAGVIANSHTDTFVDFDLALPVVIPTGDNFFVGFRSNTLAAGIANFAVARDTNSNVGVSWIFAGTSALDLNDLSANADIAGEFGSLGFAGNALIRAVSVPEPSAPVCLGLVATVGLSVSILKRRLRRHGMGPTYLARTSSP